MIAIINYGLGNIKSLSNALDKIGKVHTITDNTNILKKAETLILPGVGNFGYAMKELKYKKLISTITDHTNDNKKLIAICLGMQLLLDKSEESEDCKGLGIIPGKVKKLLSKKESFPHITWKDLELKEKKIENFFQQKYYFVHSYFCDVDPKYIFSNSVFDSKTFPSIIKSKNNIGIQFHPEKSGEPGLDLLNYFLA